jgi:hypothetical protein
MPSPSASAAIPECDRDCVLVDVQTDIGVELAASRCQYRGKNADQIAAHRTGLYRAADLHRGIQAATGWQHDVGWRRRSTVPGQHRTIIERVEPGEPASSMPTSSAASGAARRGLRQRPRLLRVPRCYRRLRQGQGQPPEKAMLTWYVGPYDPDDIAKKQIRIATAEHHGKSKPVNL